jgi:hypothetical protein
MAGVGRLSETFDLYPPKAEATGSNPVGRANNFKELLGYGTTLREPSQHIASTQNPIARRRGIEIARNRQGGLLRQSNLSG